MSEESRLLAAVPHTIFMPNLLKAMPAEEGGARFIYLEASNEGVDQMGEKVMAKALEDSAGHFLKFGNIDIDHFTLIGAKAGIPNYMSFEIGRPVAVDVRDGKTFVKAELYRGDGDMARNADMVWESMTALNPPARWYPSVGGAVLEKAIGVDPSTGQKVAVVKKVRWTNIGLSRTPVNQHLPAAQAAPMGTFVKSLNGFVLSEAGDTSASGIIDNYAISGQSLDGAVQSYFGFRNELAMALRAGRADQTRDGLIRYSVKQFKLQPDEATAWVDRFLGDLRSNLRNRRER